MSITIEKKLENNIEEHKTLGQIKQETYLALLKTTDLIDQEEIYIKGMKQVIKKIISIEDFNEITIDDYFNARFFKKKKTSFPFIIDFILFYYYLTHPSLQILLISEKQNINKPRGLDTKVSKKARDYLHKELEKLKEYEHNFDLKKFDNKKISGWWKAIKTSRDHNKHKFFIENILLKIKILAPKNVDNTNETTYENNQRDVPTSETTIPSIEPSLMLFNNKSIKTSDVDLFSSPEKVDQTNPNKRKGDVKPNGKNKKRRLM